MLYMEARRYLSDWYRARTGCAPGSEQLTVMVQLFLEGFTVTIIK